MRRKDQTGYPDIFPLFKSVPADRRTDPGPILKQVLKLRAMLEKSGFSMLYAWDTVEDFTKRLDALLRNFAKTGTAGAAPEPTTPIAPKFEIGLEFSAQVASLQDEISRIIGEKAAAERKVAELESRLKKSRNKRPKKKARSTTTGMRRASARKSGTPAAREAVDTAKIELDAVRMAQSRS